MPRLRLPFRWRIAVLATTAALTVLLIIVGCAATCRPGWYEPAAVDYERLRQDKVDLLQLQDDISAALNAGQTIEFTLAEDQVNRWITARGELWPDIGLDLGPLRDPVVHFAGGQIRLGATLSAAGFRPVLAVACRGAASADNVRIELTGMRIGVLPIPAGAFNDTLAASLKHSRLPATLPEAGVILLRNDFVWPNGKRRCRVATLEIGDGTVRVVIEPY